MMPTDQKTASGWTKRLQFGLQFITVRCRPGKTDHGCWSRLNRSDRPRPELLMLLGSRAVQALAVCCQYCWIVSRWRQGRLRLQDNRHRSKCSVNVHAKTALT